MAGRRLSPGLACVLLPVLALACSEPARQAPSPPAAVPDTAEPAAAAPAPTSATSPDAPASSGTPASPALSSSAAGTAPPAASAAPAAGTRIWGKSRFTWIHPSPWVSGAWTGYIGLGLSAPLKGGSLETARVAQGGRCSAWYAIEPSGYVCAGETASVDPNDPLTAALLRDAGAPDSPWPFEYGESMNTPRYDRVPTLEEMRRSEWDLPAHMAKVARARAAKSPEEIEAIDKEFPGMDFALAGTTAAGLADVTVFVRVAQRYVVKGSTIAWVRAFDVEYPANDMGFTTRTFVLTADHAVVPKDRIKPYPKSQVQGVKLEGDVRLPIAFFRKTARPKYRRGPDGAMVATGDTWPAKSWTMVTGEEVTVGKDRYVVTREEGIFARAEDAHVVPLATPPSGKILEAPGRGTWLDISVLGGWLVAYEKTKPVLATLISPGRGGIPYPGIDPLKTASTPVGNFRVDGKFRWATMVSSSNSDIVHSEVQFVQNFHGPHALHGAYWHDSFGEPKSGGCINLSPIDSKWVFDFTEPSLPEGWHGLRSTAQAGYATIVSVHR